MGATTFFTVSTGKTPAEAFSKARGKARYEFGSEGYTGTIAEKEDYTIVSAPLPMEEARALASKLIYDEDSRVNDKWGPAGVIRLSDVTNGFLFFGWASE